ncbi:MAG: BrnT family toxin [Deltaproteobacteria bacterium]|nr:BrnT family toxin [Deltaproteobacteria bacterium]
MLSQTFEWNERKNIENILKHGVSFYQAQSAFLDPRRKIALDLNHSYNENRYFCFGKVGSEVLTVRFTWRKGKIRILGAGYWRKGKKIYEEAN